MMFEKLQAIHRRFTQEIKFYRLVLKHEGTPKLSKWLLGLAVAYAIMPFDLIPDFIPVIGLLDDIIIIPVLVTLSLRMIPRSVIDECRTAVEKSFP
jgi:uncharacterized membrane protein YkvA (DUF1232 family)